LGNVGNIPNNKRRFKMAEVEFYRQGDIVFIKFDGEIPSDARKRENNVIAEGEVTGHFHKLESLPGAEQPELLIQYGLMYIVAPEGAAIVHDEHPTGILPPGNYVSRPKREFDYLDGMAQEVRD